MISDDDARCKAKSIERSVHKDRRNSQNRQRSCMILEKLAEIKLKPPERRTNADAATVERHEERRHKKNGRARKRLDEKRAEINRIVNKSENQRTLIEKTFLETQFNRKMRKNKGDKLRRMRKKHGSPDGLVLRLPPIPNGRSCVVSTTAQLQMARFDDHSYELLVPPGYGENSMLPSDHVGIEDLFVDEGAAAQRCENQGIVILGDHQSRKKPPSSLMIQQQTQALMSPPSASMLLYGMKPNLVFPPPPYPGYDLQYNTSPPPPLANDIDMMYPSLDASVVPPDGLLGAASTSHPPSPRFQNYFQPPPPWDIPPTSTLSTTLTSGQYATHAEIDKAIIPLAPQKPQIGPPSTRFQNYFQPSPPWDIPPTSTLSTTLAGDQYAAQAEIDKAIITLALQKPQIDPSSPRFQNYFQPPPCWGIPPTSTLSTTLAGGQYAAQAEIDKAIIIPAREKRQIEANIACSGVPRRHQPTNGTTAVPVVRKPVAAREKLQIEANSAGSGVPRHHQPTIIGNAANPVVRKPVATINRGGGKKRAATERIRRDSGGREIRRQS